VPTDYLDALAVTFQSGAFALVTWLWTRVRPARARGWFTAVLGMIVLRRGLGLLRGWSGFDGYLGALEVCLLLAITAASVRCALSIMALTLSERRARETPTETQ